MVNYANGLIYKLCCNDPNINDIYVGSTTNFSRRKAQHKFHCHTEESDKYNYQVYRFIRENGGWSNWSIVLIRKYSTTSKLKLERKERQYIERLNATLNIVLPTQTKKEYGTKYYSLKKDIINEKSKAKYQENKEEKKEWFRLHYQKTKHIRNEAIQCECGCMISKYHLKRHQQSEKHKTLMGEL
jgi:hypothetical protein